MLNPNIEIIFEVKIFEVADEKFTIMGLDGIGWFVDGWGEIAVADEVFDKSSKRNN